VTIQVKATEQYFPVVLFIQGGEVVVHAVQGGSFESVEEFLNCEYSSESY